MLIVAAPTAQILAVVGRSRERRMASVKDALLRALPDLMFLMDRDGVYLDYHANNPNLLYAPPSFFLGKRIRDVMPPDLASIFEEAIAKASDEPQVLNYSLPMVGGLRHFEARIVRSGRDNVLSTVRDVSRERTTELAASVVY